MANSSYTIEKQDKRWEFFMASSSRKSNPESWKLFTDGTVSLFHQSYPRLYLAVSNYPDLSLAIHDYHSYHSYPELSSVLINYHRLFLAIPGYP